MLYYVDQCNYQRNSLTQQNPKLKLISNNNWTYKQSGLFVARAFTSHERPSHCFHIQLATSFQLLG